MLKIALVTLLAANEEITFQDGTTAPARKNFGGVAKAYAHVVGEKYAKNLTLFDSISQTSDRAALVAFFGCAESWVVLSDTKSEEYGYGNNVEFVGSLSSCGKYIEKIKKPIIEKDIFDSFFGAKIIKTKEPKTTSATTREMLKEAPDYQDLVE